MPDDAGVRFIWRELQGYWVSGDEFYEFASSGGKYYIRYGVFSTDILETTELLEARADGEYKVILKEYSPDIGKEGGPYKSPEAIYHSDLDLSDLYRSKKIRVNAYMEYTWGGKTMEEAASHGITPP